jgi:hypothetical protein
MYAASTVVPVRDASTLSAAQVFGALWACPSCLNSGKHGQIEIRKRIFDFVFPFVPLPILRHRAVKWAWYGKSGGEISNS